MNTPALQGSVYLVDDDAFILQVHADLLRSIGLNVHLFTSSRAFLNEYVSLPCECILSDLRMPEVGGLQLQTELLERGVDTPIIFITGHADVATAVEAMRRGAFDYVEKPVHGQQLLDRVNAALELSRERHRERLQRQARDARLALLTAQERKIVQWVVQGHSSREIAALANLSVRTVENHRARIMDKLHVGSVVELVRLLL
ncbi:MULTISPECIES: response regulator [Pseudomonas]|uniref:Response regulator transcription factor n=1 Tax=Serpens gallinarum TaxID=2763075 RepID=A0ABR8TKF5_9PSED|nr:MULTISPECIES: response regulator [Pseudomonas]MBD7976197.1 response regulator transcription factor [Serpens gallinarum]MBF0675528.1 response regulator transcription factor [Pseudomonas sp.]